MVFQRYELNGSEKPSQDWWLKNFSFILKKHFHKYRPVLFLISYFLFLILQPPLHYLNFKVTTASTTVKMVTTQKRTAILLS